MFSRKYCTELTSLSTLSVFEVEIWCYRGGMEVPKWIERNQGTSAHLRFSYQADEVYQNGSRPYALFERTCRPSLRLHNRKQARAARSSGRSCSALRSISVSPSSRPGSNGWITIRASNSKLMAGLDCLIIAECLIADRLPSSTPRQVPA